MGTARADRRVRGVYERPTGSNIWWIRYVDDVGRLHREKVGPKALAISVYQKRKTEIRERRFFPERFKRADITLAAAIDDYMARTRLRLRRTADFDRYARLWKSEIGELPLRQLTAGDIERIAVKRRAELSAASVNRELTFIRAVLYKAHGDGRMEAIPFGRGAGKVRLFRESRGRTRYLTDDELERLREAIAEEHWPKIAVAIHTGLRRGNQFRLRWADVNFDTGLICAERPKGQEDPYFVPMNDELRSVLRALPSRMRSPWVFPSETGKTPLDGGNFSKREFKDALVKAGITNFRWHDLRHTFASRLAMKGVPLRTVQALLNHRTLTTTLRYSHLTQDHLLDAVQLLVNSPASDTATDTSPSGAEASNEASAEVIEIHPEINEPSGTRTRDPLLKRQML